MLVVDLVGFSSVLTTKYAATDDDLPIAAQHLDRLMSMLGEGDHTYLIIEDGLYKEVIRVSGTCSTVVVDRGLDGTKPHTFPRGSCVTFTMCPSAVKGLICETDCCEPACEPVTMVGNTMPVATVGVPFEGVVMFAGSTPIRIAVGPVPAWVSVSLGTTFARFTGIPTTAGSSVVAVSAVNQGAMVATSATINVVAK